MSGARESGQAVDKAMLHAYADGQLDAALRATVETWLAEHPEIAEDVQEWRAQNEALRAAFDPVLEQPIPARLAGLSERRGPGANPWRQAAAAIGLLVLGGVAGWLAPLDKPWSETAPGPSAFVADAAAAYRLYTVEVRHPVEVGGDQETHLVAWLSKRLGSKIAAPKLADFGFHLVGGRLLPGQSAGGQAIPAALLMYEDVTGKRVTCYVAGNVDNHETAFQFRQADGVSTFFWIDNGLGYAMSGEIERDKLLALAREVYRQLEL
ncbi:MAG: anti-sigma factor [Rhodospirillales bacterium]